MNDNGRIISRLKFGKLNLNYVPVTKLTEQTIDVIFAVFVFVVVPTPIVSPASMVDSTFSNSNKNKTILKEEIIISTVQGADFYSKTC